MRGKGRRPDFLQAARPEVAEPLIEYFVAQLRGLGLTVATGRFRAMMDVELVNEGPVTLWLDTADVMRDDVRRDDVSCHAWEGTPKNRHAARSTHHAVR